MRIQVFGVVLTMIVVLVIGKNMPITFHSSQHPNSILIKFEMEPEVEMRLRSSEMIPGGDHWTTVSSFGPKLAFTPSPDSESVIFNEPHQGKFSFAFYQSFR